MDTEEDLLLSFHIPINNNSQYICGLCKTSHGHATTIGQDTITMFNICKCKVKKFRTNFSEDSNTRIGFAAYDHSGRVSGQLISRYNIGTDGYLLYGALMNDYLLMKKKYKNILYYMLNDNPKLYTSCIPRDVLNMILDFEAGYV